MSDNDPKRPTSEFDDLGQRIRQNVHDEINARLNYRQQRQQAKMERRQQRWSRRGIGGIGGMGGIGVHGASGGLVVGLILAGIGAVLLLQNLNVIPDRDLWDFWPVILIVAGVSRAATAYSVTGRMWGGLVALGGGLFLAANLGFIHRDLWMLFWPVVLIVAGGAMLVRALERNHYLDQWRTGGSGTGSGSSSPGTPSGTGPNAGASRNMPPDTRSMNMVQEFAMFGGAHRRIDSQEFEGGSAVALFGGVQLDLLKADMKLPEVNIDITAAFGGVEIKVPETWAVSMRVTSIFGGYDDKTHLPSTSGPTKPPLLTITGAVIFGGLVVKN